MSKTDEQEQPNERTLTRIMVRPVGSPLPLGFFAFGIGVLLLSAYELHWITAGYTSLLALFFLGIAAPLEAVSMVFCFLSRDTLGATTMGLFSAGWVCQALFFLNGVPVIPNPAIAFLLLALGASMTVNGTVALGSKPFFSVILYLAAAKLWLSAAHYFGAGEALSTLSAITGFAIVGCSYYGALALLLEDAKQRTVLPLFRRGPAREAIESELSGQLGRIPREAGVRKQL